jgi:hypothetical protein
MLPPSPAKRHCPNGPTAAAPGCAHCTRRQTRLLQAQSIGTLQQSLN